MVCINLVFISCESKEKKRAWNARDPKGAYFLLPFIDPSVHHVVARAVSGSREVRTSPQPVDHESNDQRDWEAFEPGSSRACVQPSHTPFQIFDSGFKTACASVDRDPDSLGKNFVTPEFFLFIIIVDDQKFPSVTRVFGGDPDLLVTKEKEYG